MGSQFKVSSNRIEKMVVNKAPYIEMDNSVTHGQVAYNHTTSNLVIYFHETSQDKLSEA